VARKNIAMTAEEVQDFLAAPRTLEVVTIGPDGHPHAAPMWFVLREGEVWFRSFSKSQKIVNLRRDPRITILVEDGVAYSQLRGVMVQGHVELSSDPDLILSLYRDISRRYPMINDEVLPAPSDVAVTAAFGPYVEKNTAVRVIPDKVVSWDHRKIGGGY
jgi:PPOX class probable F420-dependent enzyme